MALSRRDVEFWGGAIKPLLLLVRGRRVTCSFSETNRYKLSPRRARFTRFHLVLKTRRMIPALFFP